MHQSSLVQPSRSHRFQADYNFQRIALSIGPDPKWCRATRMLPGSRLPYASLRITTRKPVKGLEVTAARVEAPASSAAQSREAQQNQANPHPRGGTEAGRQGKQMAPGAPG